MTFGLFLLPRTPEATEKCPLDRDERLSCSWHLSNSPLHNTITLYYEQPVKPSELTLNQASRITTPRSIIKVKKTQASFQRQTIALNAPTSPPVNPTLPGQEKEQREGFLPLVLTHLCCLVASLCRNFSRVTRTYVYAKFQGKCYSQSEEEIILPSKEKWLTINQAFGSHVILMLLTALRILIKYSIINNNAFKTISLMELSL